MAKTENKEYPTELVEKANFEIRIFERVAMDTGIELLAEVIRLREIIARAQRESDQVMQQGQT